MRRAPVIALLSLAIAACSNDSDMQAPKTVRIVPDLTAYNTVALVPEGRGQQKAAGTFAYMVVDGAIDWYVFANNLAPMKAYRVVLIAADGKEYAVASRRADGTGALGAHGVETALMNRQCVGAEDPSRRTLESARTLQVSLKTDGSASGASSNDLLGSRSALPCGGNGDGKFEYVLRSADQIAVGP